MVGKLRAQLGRVMGARGSWVVGSLLLASTLLTGCNGTSATSASDATASATSASDSISSTTTTAASTSAATASAPAATDKSSVDVTWSAPTTNTNGSALTDLAGYTIYYGTTPGNLNLSVKVPNAGATDYVVQGLTDGTWYFAVTAYTSAGLQSTYSIVVSRTIT
jgi:hypothetical protein